MEELQGANIPHEGRQGSNVRRTLALGQAAIAHLSVASLRHAELVKNSGAIAIGTGAAAALGFVYWWLAARSFSPEAIGKASALLSLMGLAGILGEAGLGTLLTGEIIRRPGCQRGLIAAAALAALVLSLGASGLGLLLLSLASGALGGVNSSPLSDLWLIVGSGLTGLCFIIDQAFVGMLQSTVRMLRQLLFSAGKLVFLAAVAMSVAMWSGDESTILMTWVAAQMVSLVVAELLARRYGGSLIQRPDFRQLRALKRKAAHHYMLDLGIQAPSMIMPYLVTVLLSPTSNAAFTVIWMVVSVASVVPGALATVLFPIIRLEPDQYRDKMLLSLASSLAFAIACSLLVFMYSSEILSVFNPVYAEIGGASLRFLGFGLIGLVIKFHVCAGARLRNSMREASIWFCVGGLFELTCAAIGSRAAGLEGLVIGWVAGVLIEGFVMCLMAVRVAAWNWAEPAGTDDPEPV